MALPRILIADDDPQICAMLQRALNTEPWTIEIAQNGCEALILLCEHNYDVAVLDYKMPHLDGIEVLQAARQKNIPTDIIILTGYGTIEAAVQAMKIGAQDFIQKPFRKNDFTNTIRKLIEKRNPSPHVLADKLDAFVKDHAFESSLKLSGLCEHFKISPAYVARLFQKHVGSTFQKRLAHYRIQKAKELLETTDMPIYQIAEVCGFKHYRQLTKTFQRTEKQSPTRYRKICIDKGTK